MLNEEGIMESCFNLWRAFRRVFSLVRQVGPSAQGQGGPRCAGRTEDIGQEMLWVSLRIVLYVPRLQGHECPHPSEHQQSISGLLFVTHADIKFSFVFCINSDCSHTHARAQFVGLNHQL